MFIKRKYFKYTRKDRYFYSGVEGSKKSYDFVEDITFESKPAEAVPGHIYDYGVKHFTDEGQPSDGMQETKYPSMKSPKWSANRKPFIPFMPEHSISDFVNNFQVPSMNDFWNMVITARKFQTVSGQDNLRRFDEQDEKYLDNQENCLEARINLLVNLLDFKDTGTMIGDDLQLVYAFSAKWSQIEIYLSKDSGVVTELVLYDQTNRIETRFPVRNMEGYIYLFLLVYGDLFQLNFQKLELFGEDEYWVNEFGLTYDYINVPTKEFINYILDGNCIIKYHE